jgi:anaerobic selenocysteine-containing dehydrogenase/ferredoxin-NADP reductase
MVTETRKGYCTLCRSRCGTLNEVRGDMLVRVQADPDHPTGQALCMKGRAAPELVHSPQRVLHPMRRTRPKGDADPGWVRIGWDEAMDEVASRLGHVRAQSGAEAVAFAVTTPSGTPLSDSIDWIERFVRVFGSPNICYGTEICNWHKDHAHAFTFGCGIPVADYENADVIVLWGHNPANTWLAQANAIGRGRGRGAKLVVVDPRPTALARQADVWLPVRPGTDAALALGIIHQLVERGGHDDAFVREWTNAPCLVRSDTGELLRDEDGRLRAWSEEAQGPVARDGARPADLRLRGAVHVPRQGAGLVECRPVFELLAQAASRYTPDTVRSITGVDEASLLAAARLFSGSPRIAYHAWTGLAQHANATQSERAVATLYALTGSFDRIGGNRIRKGAPVNAVNGMALLPAAQRAKALGIQERPIGPPSQGWITGRDLYKAISDGEPYRVRALVGFGTNLLVSQADTADAKRALEALEFHVQCDLFETPAARYADILLPVNTPWEREGLRVGFEINDRAASLVQLRPRMVSPRGESRSDNDIVFDLACRLGMGADFFGGSVEAGWNHILAPTGLTVAQLRQHPGGIELPIDAHERKYMSTGFGTPSGRVELYSDLLRRHGQPPLPTYVPTAEDAADAQFPLVLSSVKNGYYCHSQHRSLVSLRKRAPEPVAELGAATAAARGVENGDPIVIRTRVGQARFIARIVPALAEGMVFAEYGWWQSCPELDQPARPEANFNDLIDASVHDPVSGAVPHRSSRCEVALAPDFEPRQRRWSGWRSFVVRDMHREAHDVLCIQFESSDGQLLPDFQPGQHLELRVESGAGAIARAYSLTGPAQVPNRLGYSIAVRHHRGISADGGPSDGAMSGRLHKQLRAGMEVWLRAPSGGFVLPRALPTPLICVAAGIGITPFMSLLESLPDGHPQEIHLFHADRNSARRAFGERIAFHTRRLPGLRVVRLSSRPLPGDRAGEHHDVQGHMSGSRIGDDLLQRRARVYMCGPPAMMDAVRANLVERGMPAFDIFQEVFCSPPAAVPSSGQSFRVTFARSRQDPVLWTPEHGSLLAFAESLGLELHSGCRVGQCESCETLILGGRVRHLHGVEPQEPGRCLTCQSVPLEDLVLDV